MLFAPTQDKVKEVYRSYLNLPFFFFALPPLPFLIVGSVGLLCEKVKKHPALSNKQRKVQRKNVVSNAQNVETKDLEFIENNNSKLVLFLMQYLGQQIVWALRNNLLRNTYLLGDLSKLVFKNISFQTAKNKYTCTKLGNFEH